MRLSLSAPVALVLLLALATLPGGLLLKLELNNAPEIYFPLASPAVQFESALREEFPLDEVLVVLLEGDDLFDDVSLAAMEQVVRTLQAHPRVDRVLALSTLDHIRGTADGFTVEPLLDTSAAAQLDSEQRRARVLSDRFAPGLLVSRDAGAVALVVRPVELEESLQRLDIQRATLNAIAETPLHEYVSAVGGQIALDVAQLRAMIRDSAMFIPLTTGLGLALIGWMFRRWMAVLTAGLVIGAVVSSSVGLLILAGRPYTLISAILPPLMAALSVALLIHWFNALALAAHRGLTGQARVNRALLEVRRPAIFTALTTSAGLASLSLSPIRPIEAFGLVAAAGALLLAAVVLLLLPPIFARWDRSDWAVHNGGIRRLDRGVRALRDLGMRRPLWVLGITGLILVLGVPQIARVQTETDLFRFFKQAHPITQSNERIRDRLSGVTTLEVVFDGPGRDSLQEPARLELIRDYQRWTDTLPEVDRSTSMAELIEEMHWAFHDEDPDYRALPDDAALIAQYLFIYDGIDLHEVVNREFDRTRLMLNLNVHGAREINRVIALLEGEAAARDLQDMSVTVGGFGRLFGDQETLLIQGQVRGLAGAVVLIFLLMALQWRSASASAVCMIPNLAPIVVIFSIMGLLGIWLDMATAMIASVAVGIAVDDTIHVYHGYRRRVKAGLSPVWALARTYQQAGRAVTATTLVLCGQFLLLSTSQFVPTIEFGVLTAVGLVTALLFDLLFLPALLIVLARRRSMGGGTLRQT
ncbi:RND transporter [Thioalkalivibrio denitrificans]|uniref:RND transporter n=1 Tax=Thioalkalivibrio denitrificans TaxID=108003 RepID=A0A1V3NQ70_9GAMM|nr:MMPL family transporter [Thioalkalivibrio denitrificans]OOG27245.1 RND transporter [Thioalkalivibrio denitrificans]